MPDPTETKRLYAADALQTAISQQIFHETHPDSREAIYVAIDAIAEYAIASTIDHLTTIASAMIFRHAAPRQENPESGTPSEPS